MSARSVLIATAENGHGKLSSVAALTLWTVPKPKSDLYLELLPQINSGQLDLLDHDRRVAQLVSLERRTARGGRESIDHPEGYGHHDDVANACAGVAYLLRAAHRPMTFAAPILLTKETYDSNPNREGLDAWRATTARGY